MNISYAITVCNELKEIKRLTSLLNEFVRDSDEVVILFDKGKGTDEVWSYLQFCLQEYKNIKVKSKTFKGHFAEWKNYLTSQCSKDFIFQIDADEVPHRLLLESLPLLLENNPTNEVYLVPRVNTVKGLLPEHIEKWKWKVDRNGWVNWPDYQLRIYKNSKDIYWANKVHETLFGYSTYSPLPKAERYCLYHPKTIEKQEKQNNYYDTLI
tara:strand:+ start:4620 stop:5249 length:630 start_codon:yes stop_codon:yes gene_type:complete